MWVKVVFSGINLMFKYFKVKCKTWNDKGVRNAIILQ